jgi:uncharacterized protein YukE
MSSDNRAELQSQKSAVERDMAAAESAKRGIQAEIACVNGAQDAIGLLKGEAREISGNFQSSNFDGIDANWTGTRKNAFWGDNYFSSGTEMTRYINALDDIHDALITREHQLNLELSRLNGRLAELGSAWSWICSGLEKLFN